MKDAQAETEFTGDFDADVPPEQQDDILSRIVEAIWDQGGQHDGIAILDMEEINALNRIASGVIEIGGREHTFKIRDGNNDGTEILSWNEDTELEHAPAIPKALVPHRSRVDEAVRHGRARQFLEDWNRDLLPGTERGDVLHDLLSKQAYDRFFSPGPGALKYNRIANELGYDVDDEPMARIVRGILHFEATVIAPTPASQSGEAPMATLERWNGALDQETQTGAEVRALRERSASRLKGTRSLSPSPEEFLEMEGLGFRFVEPKDARFARHSLLLKCFRLQPVEGFDPETLPENPVAVLFQKLDPELVRNTRVDPLFEASRVMFAACQAMAQSTELEVPERYKEQLARVGYRAVQLDFSEPDPAAEIAPG